MLSRVISRAAGVKSAANAAVFFDDSLALPVTLCDEQRTKHGPEHAEDAEQDASARAWEDCIAPPGPKRGARRRAQRSTAVSRRLGQSEVSVGARLERE